MDKYIAHLEEQNQELQQRLADAEKELFFQSALKPRWKVPHIVTRPLMNTTIDKLCYPYGTAFHDFGHIECNKISHEGMRMQWSCIFNESIRSHVPAYIRSEYDSLESAKHGFENAFWNHVYTELIEESFGHFAQPFYIGPMIKAI